MAYEYFNPHPRKLEITLPFGKSFMVKEDEYVPTPEMEKKGIDAETLKDFVRKNLLHVTPVEKRAMFFRTEDPIATTDPDSSATVPVVAQEIGSGESPAKAAKKEPKVTPEDMLRMIRSKIEKSDKPSKNLEDSLQAIADATCSSLKIKKPSKE